MLRSERRAQKLSRRIEKKRRKSNRKALQVIIDASSRRRGKITGARKRVE